MGVDVSQVAHALRVLVEGASPVLPQLVSELRACVEATHAVASLPRRVATGWELEHSHYSGFQDARFLDELPRYFRNAPAKFASYDPLKPARRDRNRAVTAACIFRRQPRETIPIWRDLICRSEVSALDQLRVVLVADGVTLTTLCLYSPDRFDRARIRRVSSLIDPMRRRLALDRLLGVAPLCLAAIQPTLQAIGRAAFIVDGRGCVAFANAAVRLLMDIDRDRLDAAVQAHVSGCPDESVFDVTPIESPGLPRHYLFVAKPCIAAELGGQLANAQARWGLTHKQAVVLGLVAQGMTNKEIAAHLGRAENTVEYHVTQLFECAQVECRAELVATFWRTPG